jgi:putative transposase
MPNTFTQIYIQVVFAVNGRQSLITSSFKADLFKYVGGTIRNASQKLIAINGMPDHVHILIGMKPTIALSAFLKDIKVASSRLINDKGWVRGRFSWQEGFGAFSYSQSHMSEVARYIAKPGASSRSAVVQRRVLVYVEELPDRARREIPLQMDRPVVACEEETP